MALNTAITNNDFYYVINNYQSPIDSNTPIHVSTVTMCDLLIDLDRDYSLILSCVTTVELFEYVVAKFDGHWDPIYWSYLFKNNHTDVILRWIQRFPNIFTYCVPWVDIRHCDRSVLSALNNCNQYIQYTLYVMIDDNNTLITKKLDYAMYKSFHELCNL